MKDLVSWAHSKVSGLESPASFVKFLVERRVIILLMIAVLVLLFFFWPYLRVLAVMTIFIILGSFSMIYNRWLKVSVGVELIMLGMVISSVAFSRLSGLVVGIVGLFLAEILSERFTHSTFVSFIGIAVAAMVAPFIFNQTGSITSTGIIITVIYDAVIIPGYLMLGSNAGRSGLFVITHILFNAWLFSFIAPLIFRMVD